MTSEQALKRAVTNLFKSGLGELVDSSVGDESIEVRYKILAQMYSFGKHPSMYKNKFLNQRYFGFVYDDLRVLIEAANPNVNVKKLGIEMTSKYLLLSSSAIEAFRAAWNHPDIVKIYNDKL